MSEQNCFNPNISSSPKVKNTILNKTIKRDKEQKSELTEDLYSCSMCEYKAKKEATLKKHIITKHKDHVCKECNDKLSSFMELLKHVAKYHSKESVEEVEIKGEKEKDDQKDLVEKEDQVQSRSDNTIL